MSAVISLNDLNLFNNSRNELSVEAALQLIKDAKNFAIMDTIWGSSLTEMQWFEIALCCAEKNSGETVANIEKFALSEEHNFAIAKLCARQDGLLTTYYCERFKLSKESDRLEIAKLCVQSNPEGATLHLQKFNLTEEQNRLEVAYVYLQQGGWIYLNMFHFSSAVRSRLITLALICNLQVLAQLEMPWNEFSLSNHRHEDLNCLKAVAPQFRELIANLNFIFSKIKNQEQRKRSLTQAASTLFLLHKYLPKKESTWLMQQQLVEAIFAVETPHLHPLLLLLAVETASNGRQPFEILKASSLLLKLPLTCLHLQGVDISSFPQNERQLEQSELLYSILEALGKLVQAKELTPSQKTKVIEKISADPIADVKHLLTVLTFEQEALLANEQDLKMGWPLLAEKALTRAIPLGQIPHSMERYENTFLTFRNPEAFRIYAANLKQLKDPSVMESLGQFASSVLTDHYRQTRYDLQSNPHLKKIQREYPTIFKFWQQESDPSSLQELVPETERRPPGPSIPEWLKMKLVDDGHMELPLVKSYLTLGQSSKQKIEDQLRQKLKAAPKQLNGMLNQNRKPESSIEYTLLTLQKKCIQLVKAPKKAQVQLLTEVAKFPLTVEFQRDVEGRLQSICAKQALAELVVVETETAQDLLLAGTEVQGSCQRIDGDPHFNKGLLGYLMHGQTHMIAVKNKVGKLVARRLIRLLVDDEKPVLFLERSYSNVVNMQIEQAMISKAKEIAQRLSTPLTSLVGEKEYGKSLQSLGGPAAFEYVDGVKGITEHGKFTIQKAQLLFAPLGPKN